MSFHVRIQVRRLVGVTMTVAAFASMATATPTTITWNDAGPIFSTGGNWTGGLVPGLGDIAEFSIAAPTNNQPTINAPASLAGLVFGSGAGAFTLSGAGPLTIGDSGITNCSTTTLQTIAVPLVLAASDIQWIKNDGKLTISGAITNDSGSGLKLAGPGSDGLVSGSISGSKDVIKYDGGTWTLSGASTFTGKLRVEAGVLNLTGTNTAPRVEVSGGATLNLAAANTLAGAAEVYVYGLGTVNVKQSQTVATLESGSSGSQASVAIDSGATLTINAPDDNVETFEGVISGAGSVAKTGLGRQIFGGANTYAGTTTITGGTLTVTNCGGSGTGTGAVTVSGGAALQIGDGVKNDAGAISGNIVDNGAVTFNRPGSGGYTYAGVISGGGVVEFDTGTVTLTGANTYNGGTTVNTGAVLVLGNTSGATLATGADVTLNGTGELHVDENQTTRAVKGDSTSKVVIAASRALTINLPDASDPTHTAATYDGTISGDGSLVIGGPGTFTLTNTSNDYYGGTVLNSGTLVVSSDAALGYTGGQVSSGTLRGGRGFGGVRALSVGEGGKQALGGMPTGGLTFNGGTLRAAAGLDNGRAVLLNAGGGTIDTNGFNSTFDGQFTGAGGLTVKSQAGNGVLTLTNSGNQWGGTTTVESGTLKIGADGALGSLGTGTVTVTAGARLDVSANQSVNSLSGAGTIEVAATKVLTIKTPVLFGAVVSGSGGVTFANNNNSNGLSTITSDQGYTGTTTVSTGKLQFGNGGAAGSVAGNIDSGSGTLVIYSHGGANVTESHSISGGGGLVKNDSGTLTMTGSHSYSGSTQITGGTLKVSGHADVLPTGTRLDMAAGTTLDVAASQTVAGFIGSQATSSIIVEASRILDVHLGTNYTFNGVMSGDGSLHVSSDGQSAWVLTLKNDNTYAGGTEIGASSVLQLSGDGTTGNKGMVAGNVVNNGFLSFARTDSVVFSGVISGGGVVKQVGSGNLSFSAANTYTGATQVYAGRLLAMNGSGSATGTGSIAVYTGGLFGGSGTVTGPLAVNSGGTVAPGADLGTPATLHAGSTTFWGGGVFAFQIKDATGSAGSDYSLLSSSGALTINATSGNPFTISVYSVNGTTQGTTANFDSTHGYSWTFVSAANGITGFDAAAFQVSTTNFQNAFTGSFGVSQAGNSLLLSYTPAAVPEPATWALLGLGLGGVWWWRRRGGAAGRGR